MGYFQVMEKAGKNQLWEEPVMEKTRKNQSWKEPSMEKTGHGKNHDELPINRILRNGTLSKVYKGQNSC